MKTSLIITAIIATVIVGLFLGGLGVIGYGVGLYNDASSLKNTYIAKISANEADFDNMKKTIQQTAQVPKAQMDKLREVFVDYAEARTPEGAGKMMSWVQESVPHMDTKTFENLQNIIVAGRTSWTERQKELVDISRQYNLLLVQFPSNIILGFLGFEKIVPLVITSADTKESFKTGEDNNVKLEF